MEHDKSANYNKNCDYSHFASSLDGQTPNVDLSVGVRLQYASGWSNRFLSVSLTGTNVSADGQNNPPKLIHDGSTHRGWYTESVLIKMWVSDHTADPKHHPSTSKLIFRKNDGPVTTGENVTVTSGTSESLSANVGTMGEMPMVGIQGGISMSKSFSESIPDFRITNNSNSTTVSQRFYMSEASGGHYSNAFSLERQKGLHQPYFVGVPEKAKSGLAISSQAIWATQNGTYDKKAKLHILLEHTLVDVSMNKYGLGKLSCHMHSHSRTFHWRAAYDVDFAEVNL